MTLFWIVAAVMVVGLLVFLLRPLLSPAKTLDETQAARDASLDLYREQVAAVEQRLQQGDATTDETQAARSDIERELLASLEGAAPPGTDPPRETADGRRASFALAIVLCITLPLAGYFGYLHLGEPMALDPAALAPRDQDRAQNPVAAPDIQAMVAGLEQRLRESPEDGEGWRMLGRSYFVLERYPESVTALTQALDRLGESADLLVGLAEAQAFALGNRLAGEPRARLERALELEPGHPKGLWLGGFAALQDGQRSLALQRWRKLLATLPAGSPEAQTLSTLVAGIAADPVADPVADPKEQASAQRATGPAAGDPETAAPDINLSISLDPMLLSKVAPGADVFVIARNPDGPPFPVAVVKLPASALPFEVSLNDSHAMVADHRLSRTERVVLTARVALSGRPIAAPGDLEGGIGPLAVEDLVGRGKALEIVIDTVLP